MVANVLEISAIAGARVAVGDTVLLLESMKMEIPVLTEVAGEVVEVAVNVGDVIQEGDPLVLIEVALPQTASQRTYSRTLTRDSTQ